MKRLILLLFVIVCVCFVAACRTNDSFDEHDDVYIIFTDDAESKISLAQKPKKVAVLFSSYAQMVVLSGGNVDVTVGESVERGFADKNTPLVDAGAGKKINNELLISQGPDLVIGSLDIASHKETAQLLSRCGIPAALFRVESFEDYERVMKILCAVFDSKDKFEENVAKVKREIEDVLSQIPDGDTKKILFVRCASSAKATRAKTKQNNFVCRMLDEMNTYNIAENADVLLDGLSIEEIILENPDYIFFSCMGDEDAAREYMTGVMKLPEWQRLKAVRNKQYTFLDKELFQYKPNNRWDEAYKILAELLYD